MQKKKKTLVQGRGINLLESKFPSTFQTQMIFLKGNYSTNKAINTLIIFSLLQQSPSESIHLV